MMSEIFLSPSRPFYQSVITMGLALLDKDFITQEGDAYFVYDHFFALWLLRGNR